MEPLLTTNLVFALVLAVPIAKASLRFWEILGAAVLCTGVALLSASRSAKPIGLSFGSVSHWPAAAVIAAVAFAAVQAGRRHPGRTRAMLTGTAAGLVFGIQDALTRQTLQILGSNGVAAMFTTWAPYALVGAGAIGIWLMQSAFNAGPLQRSLPAIAAGEPLVGMLLGVLVFGDRIQISPGELAMQAGGIVALVAGVIMVGRAPALSQLRAWTPPALPHITNSLPSLPALPNLRRGTPGHGLGHGHGRGGRTRRHAERGARAARREAGSASPGTASAAAATRRPSAAAPPTHGRPTADPARGLARGAGSPGARRRRAATAADEPVQRGPDARSRR